MRKGIFIFSLAIFSLLSMTDSLSTWESLSITIFIYFLLDFLETLGKRIVILDFTIIMASLTCLVMPVVFYHQYTKRNLLAFAWGKYMPVSSDDYFSFVIPAIIALAIGIRIPLRKSKVNVIPKTYMQNVQKLLQNRPNLGLILIAIGITSGFLDFLAPANLKLIFYFLDHLTFVGVFYVIYSPSKYKKIIVPFVLFLMVSQSLITGMFGELIFISACSLVLILLGRNISFTKKLLVAVAGICMIILIQSVKSDYRNKVWSGTGGADPTYYAELVTDRITDPSSILEPNKLFFIASRMNQGWLVATTMYKVPAQYDFAYGATIWQSIAAAIVPRFLWPDKPEAGGRANLKRFWGFNIVGYSMNIGPLGEAYANFDKFGGVIYMFCYGLFFNFVLSSILRIAEKRPTIVLWLPFLFYYSIGVETDLLSTMGSLIKGLIFTWLMFKIFPIVFQTEL